MTATLVTGVVLYKLLSPTTPTDLVKTSLLPCQSKHCNPMHQIQVDTALNTVMRDDTRGGGSLKGAQRYIQSRYTSEAEEHPGVQLVAHTVA